MYSAEIEISDRDAVPVPTGYHILIAVPSIEEKTKGGIIRPDQLRQLEKTASIFGLVLAVGPDAYKDEAKFPSGPWCKVDDWVVFRSYSGTRFIVNGQELRLINDDTVEAVVADPRQIERV